MKKKPLNVRLDKEERELLRSVERGEWQSVPNLAKEKKRHHENAKAAAKKNARVNIRLSESDLWSIRNLATEEGIPYQTLMASVLHKYASGRLVSVRS